MTRLPPASSFAPANCFSQPVPATGFTGPASTVAGTGAATSGPAVQLPVANAQFDGQGHVRSASTGYASDGVYLTSPGGINGPLENWFQVAVGSAVPFSGAIRNWTGATLLPQQWFVPSDAGMYVPYRNWPPVLRGFPWPLVEMGQFGLGSNGAAPFRQYFVQGGPVATNAPWNPAWGTNPIWKTGQLSLAVGWAGSPAAGTGSSAVTIYQDTCRPNATPIASVQPISFSSVPYPGVGTMQLYSPDGFTETPIFAIFQPGIAAPGQGVVRLSRRVTCPPHSFLVGVLDITFSPNATWYPPPPNPVPIAGGAPVLGAYLPLSVELFLGQSKGHAGGPKLADDIFALGGFNTHNEFPGGCTVGWPPGRLYSGVRALTTGDIGSFGAQASTEAYDCIWGYIAFPSASRVFFDPQLWTAYTQWAIAIGQPNGFPDGDTRNPFARFTFSGAIVSYDPSALQVDDTCSAPAGNGTLNTASHFCTAGGPVLPPIGTTAGSGTLPPASSFLPFLG